MENTGYAASLETVSRLALELTSIDTEIVNLGRSLDELQKRRDDISKGRLPELFDELGYSDFRLSDGRRLEMKSTIRASIPTDAGISRMKDILKQREAAQRRANALQWLRDNDLGDLIKNEVSVQFSRGEEEKADSLHGMLAKEGYNVEQDSTVNSQTLSAQIRELLEQGAEVPLEILGVQIERIVSVK